MGFFSLRKKVKWFKTGQSGTRIAVRRFPSDEYAIVLLGVEPGSSQWDMARTLGYRANDEKTELIKHFQEGARFTPDDFQRIFPQSHTADVDPDEKFLQAPDTLVKADHLRKLEPIGPNYLHETVFEYKGERFVENARFKIVSERQDNTNNARFLIAETLSELDLCADGFVQRMAMGQVLTPYDLRLFAGQLKRSHLAVERTDAKLQRVQHAMAAAISRRFSREFSKPTYTAYNFAVKLTENMPAMIYGNEGEKSHAVAEISTPLPITVAAQMLLGDSERKNIFAPYAGNGSIIGILARSAYITALQLDESKKIHLRKLRPNINLVQTDIVETSFDQKADLTICELPEGELTRPYQVSGGGPLLYKKDHFALLRTLQERVDLGTSVFILSSDQQDRFNRKPGRIGQSDEPFFKWLSDRYQILGAIDCHDELYLKQGRTCAKRLLLIGQKLSKESSLYRASRDILVVSQRAVYRKDGFFDFEAAYSWQELWDKALFARAALLCQTDPDLIYEDKVEGKPAEPQIQVQTAERPTHYVEVNADINTDEVDSQIAGVIEQISQTEGDGVNTTEDFHNQVAMERNAHAERDEKALAQNQDKNSQNNQKDTTGKREDDHSLPSGQFGQEGRSLSDAAPVNKGDEAGDQEFSFEQIGPSLTPSQVGESTAETGEFSFADAFEQQGNTQPSDQPSNVIALDVERKAATALESPHGLAPSADDLDASSLMDALAKPDVSYAREIDTETALREKAAEIKSKILRENTRIKEQPAASLESLDLLVDSYRKFDPVAESGRNAQSTATGNQEQDISISEGVEIEGSENDLIELKEDQNVFRQISQTEVDPALLLNPLQAPYVTASALKESRSMAPRALVGAYARAFEKFQNHTKMTVDDYCKLHLQCDERLLLKLYAEQIDVIALSLHAMSQGRGMIMGDKTGRGKGKSVAGVTRAHIKRGVPVIFLTKKTNLFSDQWHDLQYLEIDQELSPFVFNMGVSVLTKDRKPAFPMMSDAKKRKIMTDYVVHGISPFDEFNYFMLSYSQLGILDTLKSKFFSKLCADGAVLLMDESHIAAGAGNINFTVSNAVRHAKSVLYSSATYSKGAKNLSVYSKVLPPTINADSLTATLEAGGDPLLETISMQMAEDGVYLSRESDTSKTMRVTLVNERDFFKNRAISDKHSEILTKIKQLSTLISEKSLPLIARDLTLGVTKGQSEAKIKIAKYNFNAYLPRIMEQFDLAISVPMHVKNALDALENNQKAIISLVNTNESAILEILSSFEENDSIRERIDSLDPDVDADEIDRLQAELSAQTRKALESAAKTNQDYRGLSYKSLLKRFVNKICKVKAHEESGIAHSLDVRSYKYKHLTEKDVGSSTQELLDYIREISETIDLFPELPISPIDTIKSEIQKRKVGSDVKTGEGLRHPEAPEHYCVGEISGRTFTLSQKSSQPIAHELSMRDDDINETVNGFNDGLIDVIILTSSGSTGLSVHAGEDFKDRRQRVFLIAQIHPDDTEQQQSEGRADRITQVCTPIIASARNGLVYQDRRLSMANAKRRTASALTNSSSKNFRNMDDVPDIMTRTGEEVIRAYLNDNPDVCDRMGIDLSSLSQRDPHVFSKNLFNGLCLLPSDLSEEITQEVYADLSSRLAEKEAAGETETTTPELDIRAKVEKSKVFVGLLADGYLSRFEEPVLAQSIVYREISEPILFDDTVNTSGDVLKKGVATRIKESLSRLSVRGVDFSRVALNKPYSVDPQCAFVIELSKKVQDINTHSLPSQYESVKEALAAKEDNLIKQNRQKLALIKHYLGSLRPGSFVALSLPFEGVHSAVVEGLYVPRGERQLLNLGQYYVNLAIPGQSKPIKRSFHALLKDESFEFLSQFKSGAKTHKELAEEFRRPQSIVTNKRAVVLSNNLLKAAEVVSASNKTRPVIISDEYGVKRRVLILKKESDLMDLYQLPLEVPSAHYACRYLDYLSEKSDTASIGTLDYSSIEGHLISSVSIIRRGDKVSIVLRPTKEQAKRFISERALDDLLLTPFARQEDQFIAKLDKANLHALIERLYIEHKVFFKAAPVDRAAFNELLYKDRVKNPRSSKALVKEKQAA